jgi:3-oxoacyl-[acyl-carrier protein] reductase
MLLEGRTALVTGSSRGIGAASARLLAAEGAAVAVNYFHSEEAARALVGEIEAAGGRAAAYGADIREQAAVSVMVEAIEGELGPLDTVVINASIGFPMKPFLEYRWEEFEAKLTGELRAAFWVTQAVVPGMIERRRGCIIGISSGLARHSGFGFSAHSSAKAGLEGLMRSLALELGPHGIRVNTVAPGLTVTDATAHLPAERREQTARVTPLGRLAQPADVAGAVLLLASDHACFVSGGLLAPSGGIQMA